MPRNDDVADCLSKKVKTSSYSQIYVFSVSLCLIKTQNDSAFSRSMNHNNVKLITQIEQTVSYPSPFVIL